MHCFLQLLNILIIYKIFIEVDCNIPLSLTKVKLEEISFNLISLTLPIDLNQKQFGLLDL